MILRIRLSPLILVGLGLMSAPAGAESLTLPKLLDSYNSRTEQDRAWNKSHPLMGLDASSRPPYWSKPLPHMRDSYAASIARFELALKAIGFSKGDRSILLAGELGPESASRYLMSVVEGERGLRLRIAAALFALPGMPGDPKRTVGAIMQMADGLTNESAGKDFGNWQVGWLSYEVGATEDEILAAANLVQLAQDIGYIVSGASPFDFDHPIGMDDPRGTKLLLEGRDFGFRQVYRDFLKAAPSLELPKENLGRSRPGGARDSIERQHRYVERPEHRDRPMPSPPRARPTSDSPPTAPPRPNPIPEPNFNDDQEPKPKNHERPPEQPVIILKMG